MMKTKILSIPLTLFSYCFYNEIHGLNIFPINSRKYSKIIQIIRISNLDILYLSLDNDAFTLLIFMRTNTFVKINMSSSVTRLYIINNSLSIVI